MSWTYSDWDQQETVAERLTRLKKHMKEVRDALSDPYQQSHGNQSMTKHNLRQYLEDLRKERDRLEEKDTGEDWPSFIGTHPSR